MRVVVDELRGALRRLRKDERGVSAVVIAVSLLGIVAALVLSVDSGNLWTTKRSLVQSTDSAALSGAKVAADMTTPVTEPCPASVQSAALAMIQANQPRATTPSGWCTLTITAPHTGYITVNAVEPVQVGFGRVLGVGNQQAFSSTSVKFGFGSPTGLRPISFCKDNPFVANWLIALNANDFVGTHTFTNPTTLAPISTAYNNLPVVDPTDYEYYNAGDGQTHVVAKVYFSKQFGNSPPPGTCTGSSSGNWGYVDFGGGANSTSTLGGWFVTGYQGHEIAINDCDPTTAGTQYCAYNPGFGGNSLQNYFDQILNVPFAVPLFDSINNCGGGGGGNNGCFNVWGFLGVILRDDSNLTGNSGYIGFELTTIQLSGSCCNPNGTGTGATVATICSVDHDPVAASDLTRCATS